MADRTPLHLFEGIGIELEYMIVDAERLNVLPICDQLMQAEAGELTSEIEFPDITWNNELVLHVIELKTSSPVASLDGLADRFNEHIQRVQTRLTSLGGVLMPTSMHPWMNPETETRLWTHELSEVYDTFNRIFDCRGHGWSNLQSLHINLPFANDEEFGRLHAAIRLILPILPALAASSPIVEGRATSILCNRMEAYRRNAAKVPAVSGRVIPEPVFTIDGYQDRVLNVIYQALKPHDPEGVLQHEWVNARGAIPRFERQSIEIRILDVQECPAADVAIAALVVAVLKLLTEETWSNLQTQQSWAVDPLADLLEAVIREGEHTRLDNRAYLATFGWPHDTPCTAGQLWQHLLDQVRSREAMRVATHNANLDIILQKGPVARRILDGLSGELARDQLSRVYAQLHDRLITGRMFGAG